MVLFAVDFRFGGTTMSDDVLKNKKNTLRDKPLPSTPTGPAIPTLVLGRSRRHTLHWRGRGTAKGNRKNNIITY